MGVGTDVERWRELPASATVAGISEMLGRETGSVGSGGAAGLIEWKQRGRGSEILPGVPSACLCLGIDCLDIITPPLAFARGARSRATAERHPVPCN